MKSIVTHAAALKKSRPPETIAIAGGGGWPIKILLTMNVLNAIAKVRFNSARPQRVQLHKSADFACDLLCLEPGQEFSAVGRCAYYFIAGNGVLKAGKDTREITMGHFAACDQDESHTIVNSSEQRLICLAVSRHH